MLPFVFILIALFVAVIVAMVGETETRQFKEREPMPEDVKNWLRNNRFYALNSFERNKIMPNMLLAYLKDETNISFRFNAIKLFNRMVDSFAWEGIIVQLSTMKCPEDSKTTIYQSYTAMREERNEEFKQKKLGNIPAKQPETDTKTKKTK